MAISSTTPISPSAEIDSVDEPSFQVGPNFPPIPVVTDVSTLTDVAWNRYYAIVNLYEARTRDLNAWNREAKCVAQQKALQATFENLTAVYNQIVEALNTIVGDNTRNLVAIQALKDAVAAIDLSKITAASLGNNLEFQETLTLIRTLAEVMNDSKTNTQTSPANT